MNKQGPVIYIFGLGEVRKEEYDLDPGVCPGNLMSPIISINTLISSLELIAWTVISVQVSASNKKQLIL